MAPCPGCDAANARAREMHRRAQVAEGEAKRLREALALTEAALAHAQLERGLAQADRQRAEHERDEAKAANVAVWGLVGRADDNVVRAERERAELLRRLELFDNTVCWNVACAHEADALDLHVLLDQLRDAAKRLIASHDLGRSEANDKVVRDAWDELERVVALSPVPTRAPIDLQCPVCGVSKRPEDACPFCATEGK